jgi:multisubunit Na+/H+ antiporter MnhF subunit
MVYVNEPIYLDAVVIMALITFFGTIAFARYLEKGVRQ